MARDTTEDGTRYHRGWHAIPPRMARDTTEDGTRCKRGWHAIPPRMDRDLCEEGPLAFARTCQELSTLSEIPRHSPHRRQVDHQTRQLGVSLEATGVFP